MPSFFEQTRAYIGKASSELKLNQEVLAILEKPKNVFEFDLPVPLSDGSTKIFKAWKIQHNDARGPYKGGIRFHPASSLDEVEALASIMTWKTALAGIPFGGAKGVVTVDPKSLSAKDLEAVSRSYVRKIVDIIGPERDIPAPDVGTNPQIMAWMADEYGTLKGYYEPAAFTGKPVEIGGSQGREVSTGFGGAIVLREFLKTKTLHLTPHTLRVAVQGFGNVGAVIARELFHQGYRVVGLSDSKGAIMNPQGFHVDDIVKEHESGKRLSEIAGASIQKISNEELLEVETDILIPAALEGVITVANAPKIKAKTILEMANGPTTPEADAILAERGIEVIPDILANAGGVVGSYFEWVQGLARFYWEEDEVLGKVEKIMVKALRAVAEEKSRRGGTWREASYRIAVGRVAEAMKVRGWV